MQNLYNSVVRPVLFAMNPERIHNLTLRSCEIAGAFDWIRRAARARWSFRDPRLSQTIAGIYFENPIGLAAGFDKNGRAIELMGELGFGHVEIGSISAHPSKGNPRPRLFRIRDDEAIIVNYGVPNEGADVVANRLKTKTCSVPLGINLVKTNDSLRPTTDEEVLSDYASACQRLESYGSYINLNMSCPNSANDQNYFDDLPRVNLLLERLGRQAPRIPVFLKLKPTMDRGVLADVVAIADQFSFVAGFGINLPAGKPDGLECRTSAIRLAELPGAVSGRPVERIINANLKLLFEVIGPRSRYKLIAAGGVYSADDAYRKIRLGASLVQLYTALVYRGPGLVKEILKGLVELLERDGFENITDAVGADLVGSGRG